MNAIWLLVPLLAVRFGLMGILDRAALKRAAFFPPMPGREKAAYSVYQISNLALLAYPLFLAVKAGGLLFCAGLAVYGLGIAVTAVSVCNFAKPETSGINKAGLYRMSRNPMYVGYFLYFLGCVLLTRSLVLLVVLAVFQISAHWVILAEERWCLREFGETYAQYMREVRRYL